MTALIAQGITLAKQDMPPGLTEGDFQFILTRTGMADVAKTFTLAEVNASVASQVPPATPAPLHLLDAPAPGDYTLHACRLAATGERISPVVTVTLTVAAPPPAQIEVPQALTLTLV